MNAYDDKIVLIILVGCALSMIVVTVYLSHNIQYNNKNVLNNMYIIHTYGVELDTTFKEKYEKYEKHKSKIGKYEFKYLKPKSSSVDNLANECNDIVNNIKNMYDNFDSFVVLCESDTITYKASALSFMLENLNKPVIITTDKDLVSTFVIASNCKIPEVIVFSQGKLLRGSRTVQKNTDYFTSPNFPPLDMSNNLQASQEPMQIKLLDPKIKINLIKIFHSMNENSLENLDNLDGIIFEIYCSGNILKKPAFMEQINKLAKKGVVMVAVSQCDIVNNFDVDISLLQAGMLSGYDMTSPAAYAKLLFLLSNIQDRKIIGQLVEKSLRGEMSNTTLI